MTAGADLLITPKNVPSRPGSRRTRWSIRGGLLVAVLGWLWPIGVGGQIPVGGDVTQFSMGLMAFLRSSLVAGRWPVWNDLWGLGFPGLAESQMGVYYPPHWVYGLLSTETAYAASLVAHFLWGATGAAWAARRFGVSELGSALSGFAWATSGFFLIHLPHQWAYTVGSWMPWAWGLAWHVVRSAESPRRPALILGAILAIQILPGHFQMAFITEIGVLGLAVLGAGRGRRGLTAVVLALGAALPLAAAQLLPTGALARLSGGERGFEYLSGFAASPLHLVSYVAPGLFHRSPLWRPIAWDLFHTAPEEYLGYVGLVPLLLAARGMIGGSPRPEVRALTLLGVLTLILSLGPYVPGFRWLIAVPGFSFFRAPARWSLATSLALAILAGFGFDVVRRSGWTRRSVVGFGCGATLAVGLVIGSFELALGATRGVGWPEVAAGFDRVLGVFPWAGQPGELTFRPAMAAAYRPQADLRVQSAQARLDSRPFPPSGMILARERWEIYRRELGGSALLLASLVTVGILLARRPRTLAGALVALTGADMVAAGQGRSFDLGPARSLVEQSPVLARAAASRRGVRTLDPAQNLFQVAGADPVTAYRTLTLPAPDALLATARGLDPTDLQVGGALRTLGVGARVLDPLESRSMTARWSGPGDWGKPPEVIRDPTLAGWLYGVDFARLNRVDEFRWVDSAQPPVRAWRMPRGALGALPEQSRGLLRLAVPLEWRSLAPGRVEVDWTPGRVEREGCLVITQTYDPEWVGTWVGPAGATRPAATVRALEGWQGVATADLPAGRWTLRLDYDGKMARWGLLVSALAWFGWLVMLIRVSFRGWGPRTLEVGS